MVLKQTSPLFECAEYDGNAAAQCRPLLIHRKKNFSRFPSQAGMSLTKLSLGGNYDVIYKLFLPRECLVSDIPSGGGNIEKFFFIV
jgi:hypothetical protein